MFRKIRREKMSREVWLAVVSQEAAESIRNPSCSSSVYPSISECKQEW